jgi:sarcosine oxidase subunit alpha
MRLDTGGRIDRRTPVRFYFNGRRYEGYRGDTVASALLANGVSVVGRGIEYRRPRGIVGSGADESNAVVQVGEGAQTLPNQLATQVDLYDGLTARSVNAWPSVDFDVRAATGLFSRLMPPGFYYKAFMWPRGFWRRYEHLIRNAAGLGVSPPEPDPDYYDRVDARCDVLVVGGGPVGLSAALEAGRTGARVMLVDEQPELGGSLLDGRESIDGAPAMEWVASTLKELDSMDEVRLLTRSTAIGYYDHNFVAALERVMDHRPADAGLLPRQRLWRIRARQVVIATGAIERPLVFNNNDRPGIMLASAVSSYVNRYAVAPGSQAVVFANNDSAYQTALDLADADVAVEAVVDGRPDPTGDLPAKVRARGIEVVGGHAVVDASGRRRVSRVRVQAIDGTGVGVHGRTRNIGCDLVAISGGWSPAVHLHCQSGGKARYDEARACFVPGESAQAERCAGSCNGSFGLADCLSEGASAGTAAARDAGFGDGNPVTSPPKVDSTSSSPVRPMWVVPSGKPMGRASKSFVDFQTDTTVADIAIAAREGFESIEHVKRYTTLGTGADQGKLGNINGMGVLAGILGKEIAEIGTTTFRPVYTPVTFGAIAGRDVGDLLDPVRKTAIHQWHEEAGAEFENVGQWRRPWYYPRPSESMHDAVNRECMAARNGVAVVDASTLGKIDIQGRDAAEFLDRIYTNGWKRLAIGRCRYGLMLGEDGMLLDDGVTARLGDHHYMMHTTTSGAATVMSWLERWLQTEWPELDVNLTSVTDHWATVSVVGPKSRQVISKLCYDIDLSNDAFPFMSHRQGTVAGVAARVFRISFSGELTFEINVSANYGRHVWEAVMAAGEEHGITPYGTETMHVLRAEKGFIIVGQDTDGSVNPMDLGMESLVSRHKDCLGKRSLSRSDMLRDDRKQLAGLLTEDPEMVLPEGGQVVVDLRAPIPTPMIGHVTSSYYSACLGRSIALALVKGGRSRMGETIYVPPARGRPVPAVISSPIFYDPKGERQNV